MKLLFKNITCVIFVGGWMGGAPLGGRGPWEKPLKAYRLRKFETCQKINCWAFLGPKWVNKKFGFRPRDPHGEIRSGILRPGPVSKCQMVGWRPIWWQKGVIWGPLGFRAQPAHPAGGRRAGGRAVAPTRTPLVSTHPPKIAIPLLGGNSRQ